MGGQVELFAWLFFYIDWRHYNSCQILVVRKNSNNLTLATNLPYNDLNNIGQGDPSFINLQKLIKLKRVFKTILAGETERVFEPPIGTL
jgi:hypothetical protein